MKHVCSSGGTLTIGEWLVCVSYVVCSKYVHVVLCVVGKTVCVFFFLTDFVCLWIHVNKIWRIKEKARCAYSISFFM